MAMLYHRTTGGIASDSEDCYGGVSGTAEELVDKLRKEGWISAQVPQKTGLKPKLWIKSGHFYRFIFPSIALDVIAAEPE